MSQPALNCSRVLPEIKDRSYQDSSWMSLEKDSEWEAGGNASGRAVMSSHNSPTKMSFSSGERFFSSGIFSAIILQWSSGRRVSSRPKNRGNFPYPLYFGLGRFRIFRKAGCDGFLKNFFFGDPQMFDIRRRGNEADAFENPNHPPYTSAAASESATGDIPGASSYKPTNSRCVNQP